MFLFSFCALMLLVGRQERCAACKKLGVMLVVTIWSFGRLLAPVVTTTSVILSCNKIHPGDILVLGNPGPPGKMATKMERVCVV